MGIVVVVVVVVTKIDSYSCHGKLRVIAFGY